ncbi:MAG: nucleotidyltransferase family protein [Aerococcus sp.]|nr:nucleotidyltransferase family protein [Aerococcus sp.]
MYSIGVISEWNPFHNGHRYLLQEIHHKHPEAVVIGIMSGNYVQRGQPAVLTKWQRARTALLNGCDLVVELPVWYATAPADLFGDGGVGMATALGCDGLAFGVENTNFRDYETLADWVVAHPDWEEEISKPATLNRGQATLEALGQLPYSVPALSHLTIDFTAASNMLLAFSYAKANAKRHHPLQLLPIQRSGAHHRTEQVDTASPYTSSTAIRQALTRPITPDAEESLKSFIPEATWQDLIASDVFPTLSQWYPYLRYQLLSQSQETLRNYYQMYEGIEVVFQRAAKTNRTLDDFMLQVTNRQWTPGRVRRALVMMGLGVRESEMLDVLNGLQPLFLLGASIQGRRYLKSGQLPVDSKYHLISRVDRTVSKKWPLWLRADRIYQCFLNPTVEEQNFGHPPVFVQ